MVLVFLKLHICPLCFDKNGKPLSKAFDWLHLWCGLGNLGKHGPFHMTVWSEQAAKVSNLPPSSAVTPEDQRKGSKHPKSHMNKSIFFSFRCEKSPPFCSVMVLFCVYGTKLESRALSFPLSPHFFFEARLSCSTANAGLHSQVSTGLTLLQRCSCVNGLWQRVLLLSGNQCVLHFLWNRYATNSELTQFLL